MMQQGRPVRLQLGDLPEGHRALQIQIPDAGSVDAATDNIERHLSNMVPNASSAVVRSAANVVMNVALQTGDPMAQAKMIQDSRTIGTIGEWAFHHDRVFVKPTLMILDDWAGEYLFDMFPLSAMPPDPRSVEIVVPLKYAEVPLQELRAEHAPSRTIERQQKKITFSLVSTGIALELDLNLYDQGEAVFIEDVTEQVTIIQLSFLKTKKMSCMMALMQGEFLDRIFLGTMRKVLLDVKQTVRTVVGDFGVLNSSDKLGGLLKLKTKVEEFETHIAKAPMARMIFDSRVPHAVAYSGEIRNNFINAAIIGSSITERTIGDANTPLNVVFPNLLKHFFVNDPKLAVQGGTPERRTTTVSKMYILDDRGYGSISMPPGDPDEFERAITTYIPNWSSGNYQEFTLRDAVRHDEHFNEDGEIDERLHLMVKDLSRELESQGIGYKLRTVDPFVFAINPKRGLSEQYEDTATSFRVIDFWGDVEHDFLEWDQLQRNGRAWRHFVLNSRECIGMKDDLDNVLCETFRLIDILSNPDMADLPTRAFLAAPILQGPPDPLTRMFTSDTVYRVPKLPFIDDDGNLMLKNAAGALTRIVKSNTVGEAFKLEDTSIISGFETAIAAPRYPYGFGSLPGLLYLSELIDARSSDIQPWLKRAPELKVLGKFRRIVMALGDLSERCFPDCILRDGEMYTPPVHQTGDSRFNSAIALLSNTMFSVKYPYFLKQEEALLTTAFSPDMSKQIAKVLLHNASESTDDFKTMETLLNHQAVLLLFPSSLRGEMQNSDLLKRWLNKWHTTGTDQRYKILRVDEEGVTGSIENVIVREVLRDNTSPEEKAFVLRMLLESLSAEFGLVSVDKRWFASFREQASEELKAALERAQLEGALVVNETTYANARHTISAQSFLQLQRLMNMPDVGPEIMTQYRLFLPSNPQNPSQPMDFGGEKTLEFMDYAQTIATTSSSQSPLEGMAFAHPFLFAPAGDSNNNNDYGDNDTIPFFKWARGTAITGNKMRDWQQIFHGYAGTPLVFFHRRNMTRRIEAAHRKLRDPLERMGAIMAATSRATRGSLEAMLDCGQPIPLSAYALVLPGVKMRTSHVLFTQLVVGNIFVRDFIAGLSSGRPARVTVDSTHDVMTVNYKMDMVAGVTGLNSVFAVPDVFVTNLMGGADLQVAPSATSVQTAYFVNLGGRYTREYVTHVDQGMLSLAGIFHVDQFPVPQDLKMFRREPWPSSVYFSRIHKWAQRLQAAERPENIRNLESLHRDYLPAGLMFQGTTKFWNRKTGQYETQEGVGHMDFIPVEQLRHTVAY